MMVATPDRVSSAQAGSDSQAPLTVRFPGGLVGLPNWDCFELRVEQANPPLAVLRHPDQDEGPAFILGDPTTIVPGYRAPLDAATRAALELDEGQEPTLFCTLRLIPGEGVVANLAGPLALNARRGLGVQVVLADTLYAARHLVETVEPGA